MGLHDEAVGTYKLLLCSGFVLNLEEAFYVSSYSRNLISISRHVPLVYFFNFYETSFILFYKSKCEMVYYHDLFLINLENDVSKKIKCSVYLQNDLWDSSFITQCFVLA